MWVFALRRHDRLDGSDASKLHLSSAAGPRSALALFATSARLCRARPRARNGAYRRAHGARIGARHDPRARHRRRRRRDRARDAQSTHRAQSDAHAITASTLAATDCDAAAHAIEASGDETLRSSRRRRRTFLHEGVARRRSIRAASFDRPGTPLIDAATLDVPLDLTARPLTLAFDPEPHEVSLDDGPIDVQALAAIDDDDADSAAASVQGLLLTLVTRIGKPARKRHDRSRRTRAISSRSEEARCAGTGPAQSFVSRRRRAHASGGRRKNPATRARASRSRATGDGRIARRRHRASAQR